MSEFNEAVKALHEAREEMAALKTSIIDMEGELAITPLGLRLGIKREKLADAQMAEAAAEAALKTAVLARYGQSGEKGTARKSPAWIVVRSKVNIVDEARALDWCQRNAPVALETKLKRKVFDPLVKSGDVPEVIASIEEVPSVNVASDLSRYVGETDG